MSSTALAPTTAPTRTAGVAVLGADPVTTARPLPTALDAAAQRMWDAITDFESALHEAQGAGNVAPSGGSCDPVAVSGLRAIERVAAMVEARRHELLVAAAGEHPISLAKRISPMSERTTNVGDIRAVELAALLNMSANRVRNMCHEARSLCADLPQVMALLKRGDITSYHAKVAVQGWQDIEMRFANAGTSTPSSTAARFESRVLLRSRTQTMSEFKRTVSSAVSALAPVSRHAAHAVALQQRGVSIDPAPDGMAYLTAHIAATQAARVWQALEHAAKADTTLSGTLNQRMADTLVSLCDGSSELPAHTRNAAAEIQIVVSLDALIAGVPVGQVEGSGLLVEGDALMDLLADSKFRRLLVDPSTGQLLDFGRTTYRPPTALHDHVVHRDRTCRAPGCDRPARYGDIDHTIPWQEGGTTDAANLAALCRTHHVLKTHGEWRYQTADDGTTMWQLPGGSTAQRPPATYADLAPPDDDDPPPF